MMMDDDDDDDDDDAIAAAIWKIYITFQNHQTSRKNHAQRSSWLYEFAKNKSKKRILFLVKLNRDQKHNQSAPFKNFAGKGRGMELWLFQGNPGSPRISDWTLQWRGGFEPV